MLNFSLFDNITYYGKNYKRFDLCAIISIDYMVYMCNSTENGRFALQKNI